MSEPQGTIQDLMSRYGFEEDEARAYYHLQEAERLFQEMETTDEPGNRAPGRMFFITFLMPHFFGLRNHLTSRVWRRDHPGKEE